MHYRTQLGPAKRRLPRLEVGITNAAQTNEGSDGAVEPTNQRPATSTPDLWGLTSPAGGGGEYTPYEGLFLANQENRKLEVFSRKLEENHSKFD